MLKNRRGISIVTMIITFVIMSIIIGTLTYSAVDSVKIRKLNKLYDDLRMLQDAVETYYLQHGRLPVDESKDDIVVYKTAFRQELEAIGMDFILRRGVNIVEGPYSFYNPNDYDINGVLDENAIYVSYDDEEEDDIGASTENATYQFIKLELLDNLSLNFNTCEYVVNVKSHTVYNYTGVKVDGITYHALLQNYIDTQYKENHKVNQIRLKEIEGMTSVTDSSNDVFFAYSEETINLKDYLIFDWTVYEDSVEKGDGLGEPKSVTFEMAGNSRYFILDSRKGVLYRTLDGLSINNVDADSQIIATATSYGTTQVQKITLNVHMASINVCTDTDTPVPVDYVNLATNRTEPMYQYLKTSSDEYIIQKNGALDAQNPDIIPTSKKPAIAMATYTKATNKITFNSGETKDSTDIIFEVQGYGYPKDTVRVNVYDFQIFEWGYNNNLTELDFGGLGDKAKKDVRLFVDGPESITFDGIDDDVHWVEVVYDDTTGEYLEGESGIIELKDYRDGVGINFQKATITPKKPGVAYLKCQYRIAGEILGESIVPIKVLGGIEKFNETTNEYEIINDDEITFYVTGDPPYVLAKFKYVLPDTSDINGTIAYKGSCSYNDFKIMENDSYICTNNTGEFELKYVGNSSETTTIFTVYVEVDHVQTYVDDIVIHVIRN